MIRFAHSLRTQWCQNELLIQQTSMSTSAEKRGQENYIGTMANPNHLHHHYQCLHYLMAHLKTSKQAEEVQPSG